MLHAWHWPVHAVSQHTPSTQFLDLHWQAEVHATPLFLGVTQALAQHTPPAHWQSLTQPLPSFRKVVHTPLQQMAPPEHGFNASQVQHWPLPLAQQVWPAGQFCVEGTGQLPAPSQLAGSVRTAFEHEGGTHCVPG